MTRLGLSRRKIESMIAAGDLPPAIRIGRARRWADRQIDEWIAAQVEAAGGANAPRGPGRPRTGGAP